MGVRHGAQHVVDALREATVGMRLALFTFGALDALLLLILRSKTPFSTGIYFWSSLVWFAWHVYAQRLSRETLSCHDCSDQPS